MEENDKKTEDDVLQDNIIEENIVEQDSINDTDEKPNGKKKSPEKSKSVDQNKKIKKIEKELEVLQQKEKEFLYNLQRTMAEFDNFKKRTQKEKEALYKEAVAEVIGKFLPVLDSIDGALKMVTDGKDEKVNDGIILVGKKIKEILSNMGVEEIPAEGEEFNPSLHHAIMHVEDEKCDENVVREVFQKGYQYKDKVIRPSMVKVAN